MTFYKKSIVATLAITLLAILFFSLVVYAQGNSTPTVDTVVISSSSGAGHESTLVLVENTTKRFYIHGAASDADGCEEIDTATNWTVSFYKSNVSGGASCTPSNNDCYQPDESSALTFANCTGAEDQTIDYEATVDVYYYADPTDTGSPDVDSDWSATVTSLDDLSASGTLTATTEMASLIALNITSSINYGEVALGGTSSEQSISITNTGNRTIDVDQTADGDMSCTIGSISVGNVHYSTATGFTYGVSDTAATTTATFIDLTLAESSSTNLYLLLQMPVNGVGGTCSNNFTLTAKADT
jgi:hypothetical protein